MSAIAPTSRRLYHSSRIYGFQAEGAANAYLRPNNLAIWSTGIGKAEPVSEPVLTPGGWVKIGDILPGEVVYGADGRPVEVLSVHPQGVQPIYRVTMSDGSWTRCTAEHLWTVYSRTKTPRAGGERRSDWREQTLTLQEIVDRGLTSPGGRRRWRIPMVESVQHPDADLPIDPYVLGIILGDGWIGERGQVHVTTDLDVLHQIEGWSSIRDHPSDGIAVGISTTWAAALRTMGLAGCKSWEKFVPEVYLRSSEDQRRALLAGLLDSDGHPMASGGVEFCSTSEALVDAVSELAESLGGQVRREGQRTTRYNHHGEKADGRPSWRLNVKVPVQPFRLARKAARWVEPTKYSVQRYIESVERVEDEDAICIRIANPDGLYLTRHHIVTHNTHLAMILSALLFEDDLIDRVVVVCESTKLREWVSDYGFFTDIDVGLYHGPLDRRRRIAASLPSVIVSTYETLRNDLAKKRPGKPKALDDNFLTTVLKDQRVLFVYDEVTKFKNRSSAVYKAHEHTLRQLRRATGEVRTLGLTATPIEKSPENVFNIGRLISPGFCTVDQFEKDHVLARDEYERVIQYLNISDDQCEPGVTSLFSKLEHCLLVKDKFDADVRDEFPRQVEEFDLMPIDGVLKEFYETLLDLDQSPGGLGTVLRQILLHPMSLTLSHGGLARLIVGEVGVEGLRALPTPRVNRMLSHLEPIVKGEGRQAIVFTFYGQSVLPLLKEALEVDGYRVVANHGGLSLSARQEAMATFRSGEADIFLSSDAGAKGINLPEATFVLNYELPVLASTYQQRIDRVHRIDSDAEMVLARSMIAEGTIEESIAASVLERNEWFDTFIQAAINSGEHNPHRPSAAERRLLMQKNEGDDEE